MGLATGWGAESPPGDTLLRQFVLAWTDRVARTAEHAGRVERDDDAVFAEPQRSWLYDRIAAPLRPLDGEEFRAFANRARDFFAASGVIASPFPTPDFSSEGFDLEGHPPMMFRPPGPSTTPDVEALEIREVHGGDELRDFERTVVEAYPAPGEKAVIDPVLLGRGLRLWIGYVNGQPVATSGAWTAHGVTEIEWITTRGAHRGAGIGAAMTSRAVQADPAIPSVLVASDDGRPVYERLGFMPLLRWTFWRLVSP